MTEKLNLLVIFGINSRQGSSIARFLVGKPGLRIRGVTHDSACDASQFWAGKGIQIIQIKEPSKEKDAIRRVVEDASAIFVFTDYFYHYLDDHSIASLASITKDDAHYHAADREYLDGEAIVNVIEYEVSRITTNKNAILAAANDEPSPIAKEALVVRANKIPELKRLILSSMSFPNRNPVELWNMLPKGVQQFRAKAQIWEYLCWNLPHLAFRTTRLNPALRMEDWTDFLQLQPNGRLVFGTTLPAGSKLPWMHFANDTGALFHLCLQQRAGLMLAAISDTRSGAEICDFVTKITGKPCDYVQYTAQTLVQLLGPDRGQVVVDMLAYLLSGEWYDDFFVHVSHHLIQAMNAAEKYKLTTMEAHITATLSEFLREKGWDGLFKEGRDELFEEGWQWLDDRRPALPQEDPGHLFGPPRATIAERRIMKAGESSKAGGAEMLPQKPIMEPFTPPSARAEWSNVQGGESSKAMHEAVRQQSLLSRRAEPPNQYLDFFDPDCNKPIPSIEVDERGSPSSHPRRADTPDQAPDRTSQHGGSRIVSPEIIDLCSGSSSQLSLRPESRAPTPNAGEQQLEHDASFQPSDVNMQDQGHVQASSHEIIDLRSSPSSVLSSAPESEPATSEAGEQGQELDVPVHSPDADVDMRGQDQDWVSSGLSSPAEWRTPTPETAAQRPEHDVPVQLSRDMRVPDQDQVSSGLSSAQSGLSTPETGEQRQEHTAPVQSTNGDMQDQAQDQDQASEHPPSAAEPATSTPEVGEQPSEHDTPLRPADVNMQGHDQDQAASQPPCADSPDTAARKSYWSTIL